MSKPNDSALPEWVEEAAKDPKNYLGGVMTMYSIDDFLAGAQLILDRLKATEKGDASAAPPLLSGFPEYAFEQGRESVRREVLGDE